VVLSENEKTAIAFWKRLIESYWSGLSNGTLDDFYYLLREKFDKALEKSGNRAKIEEANAKANQLKQRAKEARELTNG
jgi:hypothetical protein